MKTPRQVLVICFGLGVVLGVTSCSTAVRRGRSVSAGLEGSFDVGGHKLYLRCEGTGPPTVVYLHGIIVKRGGSQSSGLVPGYLRDRARVCIYDRANVGFSDAVPGPLTGNGAVADLHRLLAAGHVPGPYLLLGSSFGGLIAVMYAGTYPEDVAGMVLLDATLPTDLVKIDDRFLPKEARLQPDDWKNNVERLDQLTTYRQAEAIQLGNTSIPLTYIATTKIDLEPSWPVEQMKDAIHAEQRAFVDRFSRGRLIILHDVPHFMERAIPRTVADEVEKVIAAISRK